MALASYPPSSFSFFENGLSEQLSRTMVYANLQPLEEHSPRVAPVAGGLLPHLLTLTAAQVPHERGATHSGGCFLLLSPAVASGFQFQKQSALCCPDFPLAPLSSTIYNTARHAVTGSGRQRERKRASDKPGHCLTTCKSNKTFSFNKHLQHYIFYFEEGKSW